MPPCCLIGLAASKEDVDRLRFLESAGNVASLVVEFDILLPDVMSGFGWSTCILARAHTEKEGENNAAPNGVVSASGRLDSSVVAAKHGGRGRFGAGFRNPASGHAVDTDTVLGREANGDVAGCLMIPSNSADLGEDGGSAIRMSDPFVQILRVSEEMGRVFELGWV